MTGKGFPKFPIDLYARRFSRTEAVILRDYLRDVQRHFKDIDDDKRPVLSAVTNNNKHLRMKWIILTGIECVLLFKCCDNLLEFKELTGLQKLHSIRRILEPAGIDVVGILHAEYEANTSINEIGRKYSGTPEMVSRWIKDAGYEVFEGNHRRGVDWDEAERIFDEKGSYRAVARALSVNPHTVKRRIEQRRRVPTYQTPTGE